MQTLHLGHWSARLRDRSCKLPVRDLDSDRDKSIRHVENEDSLL